MRKAVILSSLLVGIVCLLAETTTAQKKAAPKKTAPGKTTVAKKKTVTNKKAAPAKTPTQSWRNTQRTPSPERYKEIQQALASKGYLAAESPSGVWDNSSVEALKKFQQDQNLEPSGKIDSLSLIALGLGPKRDASPAQ